MGLYRPKDLTTYVSGYDRREREGDPSSRASL
jgi:hypothetical protein